MNLSTLVLLQAGMVPSVRWKTIWTLIHQMLNQHSSIPSHQNSSTQVPLDHRSQSPASFQHNQVTSVVSGLVCINSKQHLPRRKHSRSNNNKSSNTTEGDENATPSHLTHSQRMRKEEDEMDEDERLLASEEGKKLSSKERRQLRNKVSARAFRSRRKGKSSKLQQKYHC
jgi:hypothetical protein